MAEAALINDPELRAEKERLIQEQYNELMMQAEEDYQVAKYDLQESFFWDWVNLNDMTLENFQNLTDNEKDIIMTEMVPTWENGIKLMAEAFSGPEGFAKMTQDSWYEIKDAENEYAKDMKQLEVISGQTFDTIIKGEDDSIIKAEQLIKDNKELIDAYENELIAVQNVYEEVKKLREEYEAAEKAAIAATKAAYEYAHKDDLKNIQDLSKKDDNMDSGISEEDAKAFYESLGIPYGDNNITTKKEDIVTKNTDKTPANNIITKDKTSTPTAIPSPTIIPTPAVTPTTNNNQTTKTISAAIGGAAARLLSINKTDAQTKDSISAKDFVENNEKKQRSLILKK